MLQNTIFRHPDPERIPLHSIQGQCKLREGGSLPAGPRLRREASRQGSKNGQDSSSSVVLLRKSPRLLRMTRNSVFFNSPISDSGSILVLTLWALIVLSILGAALTGFITGQIRFSNAFTRAMASVPLAKSAVIDALYERVNDATPEYDSEKEMLTERKRNFSNNLRYKYHFEDEMAKVNINTASSEILKRLPGLGNDDDLAAAIVNSPRKPFKAKEELLLIEGMDKDNFRQFKNFVTVHGDGKININTAPAEVLAALGLEKELIEMISRYRAESSGPDGKSGTDDDGAFLSPTNVLADLREFDDLSLAEEQQLLSISSFLTVKSKVTGVKISPEIRGKTGNNYLVVIDIANKKIISWAE